MATASTWEMHPELTKALAVGQTIEEWLDGRSPVCSYARISRDLQQVEQIGVTRQHSFHNDAAAGELGWAVVYRYTDNNITAADPDIPRPAFLQMVRDLRARQTEDGIPILGVIAVEEERVVRLPEDYLKLYRALTVDENGLLYYTDKRQLVDIHAEVEQTRGLMSSSMGETEVRKVKRRTKRSTADRAAEGKYTGGARRFGWLDEDQKTGRKRNEKLNPSEAPYLRKAIDMKRAKKGFNTIARWLIDENIPTVRGGQWSASTVAQMLTNPAWWGGRILNGEIVLDRKTGQPKIGLWENLGDGYDFEAWDEICRMRWPEGKVAAKKIKGKRSARKHLSTGIARCGWVEEGQGAEEMCLHGMVGRPPHGNHKWGNYVCNSASCRRVSRRMDKVDKIVEGIVVGILEEQFSTITPDEKPWHGQGTLESLLLRRQELKDSYKEGAIDLSDYLEFKDSLDLQVKASEDDRESFLSEQASKNFLAGFTKARWDKFDLEQKGIAIETVLQAVIIHPIPKGRSRRAPFDPSLIEVVFKKTH
ncbi:recombinase family protein [Streptomyces melanogenes]|uniref:recombinase family protein n=1 Tax=Streptomyces melanogenes TaxID=67326 RepID=UPI00167E51A4|nr:recombinase family protein [Streptomyces melanogenes]GGP72242.1 integrase [Streptomyces melanogenes]